MYSEPGVGTKVARPSVIGFAYDRMTRVSNYIRPRYGDLLYKVPNEPFGFIISWPYEVTTSEPQFRALPLSESGKLRAFQRWCRLSCLSPVTRQFHYIYKGLDAACTSLTDLTASP